MNPTDTVSSEAAAAANALTAVLTRVTSVRNQTESVQKKYEAEREALKKKAAPARPKEKAAPKKEPKQAGAGTRKASTAVLGLTIPPPRVNKILRDTLESFKSDELVAKQKEVQERRQKISKLEGELKKTPEEVAAAGGTPHTPEFVAKVKSVIARLKGEIKTTQEEIKNTGLFKEIIFVADDTAHALAAAVEYIMTLFFDVVAANTVAADHRMVEIFYTLDPERHPSPERGGVDFMNSPSAPFLANLDYIRTYSKEEEEALAEKRRLENKKKKEADERAAAQRIAEKAAAERAAQRAAEGEPAAEESAAEDAVKAEPGEGKEAAQAEGQKKAHARRAKTNETSFHSYVEILAKSSCKELHPDYEKLRISTRLKEIMDTLVQQFIQRFVAAVRPVLHIRTINPESVASLLESFQRFYGRPEHEIVKLRDFVLSTANKWKEHTVKEKQRRVEEKVKSLTEAEKEALEQKRREDEKEKLRRSYEVQMKRALKAEQEAAERKKQLEELGQAAPELDDLEEFN